MYNIKNLAIIEDDPISQFIAKKVIATTSSFEISNVFSNGKEALDFFNSQTGIPDNLPDVILLDLNMPILNGWQFLEEFAKLNSHLLKKIYVFVVSSSPNHDDIQQLKNSDIVENYITKPISQEKILNAMRHIIPSF